MAYSSISIASNASILLGANTIASFEEESAEATVAANLYETSYLSLLTNHRWRFATKKAQLARLSATPLNGYQYKFTIPSDCLYVIKTDANSYEIYENEIHSNNTAMEIDYIYRVDETRLPAYFVKMFEFYLASQFAIPITGDLNKADLYMKAYETELKRAKYADSSQRPFDGIPSAAYVDVRY